VRKAVRGGRASLAGWDPTLDIHEDTVALPFPTHVGARPQACVQEVGNEARAEQSQGSKESAQTQTPNGANIRKRRSLGAAYRPARVMAEAENTTNLAAIPPVLNPNAKTPTNTTEVVKKARRRTIYIPSEDTSILTIHPGASLREQLRRPRGGRRDDIFLDLAVLSEEENGTPVRASPALKDGTQTTRGLGAPPKRVPLARSMRTSQINGITRDVVGVGGGKENLPPGFMAGSAKREKDVLKPQNWTERSRKSPLVSKACTLVSPGSTIVTEAESKREGLNILAVGTGRFSRCDSASLQAGVTIPESDLLDLDVNEVPNTPLLHHDESGRSRQAPRPSPKQYSRTSLNAATTTKPRPTSSLLDRYPILHDSVSLPSLYSADHLTPQEITLSHLINTILDRANAGAGLSLSSGSLRKEFMLLHNDDATVVLQQRLQASLRFGGLSISRDGLAKVSRIKDDLATRQAFLDLWTKTYNLDLLQAAAEVVIGREIGRNVSASMSPSTSLNHVGDAKTVQKRTKAIQSFLLLFLLRNEDVPKRISSPASSRLSKTSHADDDTTSPSYLWRRTVTRSLLLIRLLDTFASTHASQLGSACLFQHASAHKTSMAMLQAVSAMLLPSIGDVRRIVGHLDYNLAHTQYPLQEYDYRVRNIAVDLRDGVILTRLIEHVFFTATATDTSTGTDDITTTTTTIHDMDTTTLVLPSHPATSSTTTSTYPLSTHLHHPAPTRTHKLHNARLVLAALLAVSPAHPALQTALVNVEAVDLVDGHREKTLGLLWAVVLECGALKAVLAKGLLEREVRRLRREMGMQGLGWVCDGDGEVGEAEGEREGMQRTLLEWARLVTLLDSPSTLQSTSTSTSSAISTPLPTLAFDAIARTYTDAPSIAAFAHTQGWNPKIVALLEGNNGEVLGRDVVLGLLALMAGAVL